MMAGQHSSGQIVDEGNKYLFITFGVFFVCLFVCFILSVGWLTGQHSPGQIVAEGEEWEEGRDYLGLDCGWSKYLEINYDTYLDI